MKHFASGWACNFKDLFVRFNYKNIKNLPRKGKKLAVKKVFVASLHLIVKDIIDNNVTFKVPSFIYRGGEIHFEAIKGEEFKKAYRAGKFRGIDFLETFFTGYLLYLYVHGKRDDFLHRRKFPIYLSNYYRDLIVKNANAGKLYC